jgi:hypothetical protein
MAPAAALGSGRFRKAIKSQPIRPKMINHKVTKRQARRSPACKVIIPPARHSRKVLNLKPRKAINLTAMRRKVINHRRAGSAKSRFAAIPQGRTRFHTSSGESWAATRIASANLFMHATLKGKPAMSKQRDLSFAGIKMAMSNTKITTRTTNENFYAKKNRKTQERSRKFRDKK